MEKKKRLKIMNIAGQIRQFIWESHIGGADFSWTIELPVCLSVAFMEAFLAELLKKKWKRNVYAVANSIFF